MVFVGGATVHLWLTEPGAPPARATEDVDVICEVASRAEYYRLGEKLHARGLQEAVGEPVLCRWRSSEPHLVIDVMPTAPDLLGFSNPWYEEAISSSDLRTFIKDELADLRAERYFDYAVEGATASYGSIGVDRARLVRDRIDELLASGTA